MMESKTIKKTSELKDGIRVTTTETTTIDKEGRKVTETKTDREDFRSFRADPRIEEIKTPTSSSDNKRRDKKRSLKDTGKSGKKY